MVFPEQTRQLVERLAADIRRMLQRVDGLETAGLRVPILDSDPPDSDPTNLWMLNDGRLRGRDADGNIREWAGNTPGSPATADPKPTVGLPHLHSVTVDATDASCYCPVHGIETALNFGQLDATHGERRVMLLLPDLTATLTGATIQKVELRARNLDSFRSSGVTIAWGGHLETSLGATYHQQYEDVWRDDWPQVGGDTWRTMPRWFGKALRDNEITGLVIHQPSTSKTYYGRLDPALSLRITYSHSH